MDVLEVVGLDLRGGRGRVAGGADDGVGWVGGEGGEPAVAYAAGGADDGPGWHGGE